MIQRLVSYKYISAIDHEPVPVNITPQRPTRYLFPLNVFQLSRLLPRHPLFCLKCSI